MSDTTRTAQAARDELYEIIHSDVSFEEKAREALELGQAYLGADNGHLTRIDTETNHWETLVSTDPPDGRFPQGLELDLDTTYCRRTIEAGSSIALSDVPNQGWADDPAFEAHGLHCYHGTSLIVNGAPYGTVCFVAEEAREQFSDGETMFAELIAKLLERELEREQHEAQLTRQTNLAIVLNRVLRHNLRNNATVIRGFTEMMASELGENLYSEKALENIDTLIQLSEKARQLDRVIAADSEREATDLTKLVDDVVERVTEEYPNAVVTVESDEVVTTGLLPSFERALEELIDNAVKHTGDAPTVTVSVNEVPDAVEIQIVDDGPGVAEQELEVLQTGAETPLTHGSGLGLWLVHWVVTSHDGSIDAEVTQHGTRMTITIPREPIGDAQQQLTELTRSRDKYKASFEEAIDAITILNDEGRFIEANEAAGSLFGVEDDELRGRSVAEFFADESIFESEWQDFQEAGTKTDTTTITSADGEEKTIEYSGTEDVIPNQHLFIARNITERKARERELEIAETVFQTAQDALFLADVVDDEEYRLNRVNDSYENITQRDSATLSGLTLREALGEEAGEDVKSWFDDCVRSREPVEFEQVVPVEGGERIWEVRVTPVVQDDEVTQLVGAMRHITEEKAREAELTRKTEAIEKAPVGITLSDPEQPDNPLVYANERYCELTGYDVSEIIGNNCRFMQGPETDPDRVAEIRDAINNDEDVSTVLRNYRKDGSVFWNRLKIAPIRDENGDVQNWVGFQEDVTDHIERDHQRELAEVVFENSQDALFVMDVGENGEFSVERINGVYEELTGLSNAEVVGKTPREIVGERIGSEVESRYCDCVERRETIRYEEEVPFDGEQRQWETKVTPVLSEGRVDKLVGSMRAVTAE